MHHPHSRRRTGFSLTDLAVTLVLLALLLGAVLPAAVTGPHESSNRVRCASNLRQIGLAMTMYANDNGGDFPRTNFDGTANPQPTQYTGVDAANPFAADGPGPNDVTAALFLLLRTQDITIDTFLCPSDYNAQRWNFNGGNPASVSNFPARDYHSYGLHNPYPSQAAVNGGFKWDNTLSSQFAVAADVGPAGPQLTSTSYAAPRRDLVFINSRNHRGEGQNVLYADSHAEWQATPYCGSMRTAGFTSAPDNIYTAGNADGGWAGSAAQAAMDDPLDSVILPLSNAGPEPSVSPMTPTAWTFTAAGLALLAVIAVCSWLMARRAPPRAA